MDDRSTNEVRRDEARELITSGHVWSAVWYLAWPTAINTLILTAYNLINRMFLGRLGEGAEAALAATVLGGSALMMQFGLMFGLSVGTSALVSRFLGAQKYDDAEDVTRQSIILSVIGGLVSMLPLVVLATPIVRLLGAHGEVIPLSSDYLAITAYFSVPAFLYMVVPAALRSAGDVRSPLYVGVVVIGLNILLDWLLIFGVGPLPALGVRGAALATGISRLVGALMIIWFLHRSVLGGSLTRIRARVEWFVRIMRIGWPAIIQNLLWTTASGGFLIILGTLPNATAVQAAYGIALVVESLAFMPGSAYAAAATPLVGQNLGAGQPERAQHSAWVATWQSAGIMSIVAIIFVVFPEQLSMLFLSNATAATRAEVVPIAVAYLRINAISEPFLAMNMTLRGALQGAGDVRVPMWITFFSLWVMRFTLTWLLAVTFGLGATGAWIAMSASTVASGVLVAIWFRTGNWRRVEV